MTEMVFDLTKEQYPAVFEIIPDGAAMEKVDVLPPWLKSFMLSSRNHSSNDGRRDSRSIGKSFSRDGGFMGRRSNDRSSDRGRGDRESWNNGGGDRRSSGYGGRDRDDRDRNNGRSRDQGDRHYKEW